MAQRTVALYNGKHIGIETIFTVTGGKQVNIPKKVEALRALSRSNELFCPCGCGANLILVAGDRNLRKQHFRIKEGSEKKDCHFVAEGMYSVFSKIALKCWIDEKTGANDIRSRVQIKDVDDENRKYEFTFLSEQKKIALSYCRERSNLSDEKIKILDDNSKNIKIIYIVDSENRGTNGQYPEGLMKVQSKQDYCLFLSVTEKGYPEAKLIAAFYHVNVDGLWVEEEFINDYLREYGIDERGEVVYRGETLKDTLEKLKPIWRHRYKSEKQRRKEEEERLLREQERRDHERQQRLAQIENQQKLEEQRLKEKKEAEERHKKAIKAAEEERRKRFAFEFEKLMTDMKSEHPQQERKVIDVAGRRWIKCEFCGKIATDDDFVSYGGKDKLNLGTCRECSRNNLDAQLTEEPLLKGKKYDPMICPSCGSSLVKKRGPYGEFIGCSRYPWCQYKRRIK